MLALLLTHELDAELTTEVAEQVAAVITLVLRLVWTVAELALALTLYKFIPPAQRPVLSSAKKELAE